jgi:hypothetical protein
MAIDSEQKRSSGIEIPALMVLPVPDSVDSASDRSQLCDIYSGIAPLVDDFFFWRDDSDVSIVWCPSQDASITSQAQSGASSTWCPVKENPEQ